MPQPTPILLIVPSSNTTVAPEMAALLPQFAPQAIARVPNGDRPLTVDTIADYADRTVATAAAHLAGQPRVAAHCCTAAGFLAGPEGNRAIVERLRAACGIPVVSTADAMVDELRTLGARRTAVVTPYLAPVNAGLRHYLEAGGIPVDTLQSLECPSIEALVAVSEAQVLELALATVTQHHDALFIACSQLPTLGILAILRERLGIPVLSSISATAHAVERLALPTAHAQAA